MTKKDNVIRLNEAELKVLIENSVRVAIEEGRFGNMAKKVGKGIAKAGLYGALAAGSAAGCGYALDKGLEQQEKYEQNINNRAHMMNLGNEMDIQDYLKERGLEDNEFNRRQAEEYYQDIYDEWETNQNFNESKKARLAKLKEGQIAEVVHRVLKQMLG